jgi:hypothetical protein
MNITPHFTTVPGDRPGSPDGRRSCIIFGCGKPVHAWLRSVFYPAGLIACVFAGILGVSYSCEGPRYVREASVESIEAFILDEQRTVLTFAGYSGAGYEDEKSMLEQASRVLDGLDPVKTLINIGGTEAGIGAVYELAKEKGFTTMGIVSSFARDEQARISKCADYVFYVKDDHWGGIIPGTDCLSPTSAVIVQCSTSFVAIGGGEVARDEMLAARKAGKRVTFFSADMNHRIAQEKAEKKGLPEPTDFRGAVHDALGGGAN